MGRRFLRAAALAVLCAGIPAAVFAHPLGNFTINHYAGILVTPADVRIDVVIDMAEIPTFQERLKIDVDGDGDVTDAETVAAAGPSCAAEADQLRFAVDGVTSELATASSSITFPPGLGGLSTMRIECAFVAPLPSPLTRATVTFEDPSYPDRIGWREIVATGDGVSIDSGGLPTTSLSERLTTYPTDLISQPIDTRSASILVTPAPAGAAASPTPMPGNGTTVLVGAGAVPGGIGGELPAIFRELDLTPFVALLSIVTAFALGAGHALTPGHGKTIMAAYLVGTRGTSLHAIGLGLSVTVSHTLGILALAALVVGAQGLLPPDVVVRVTPVVAALTILAIGGWMVAREVMRRLHRARLATAGGHTHDHESGAHPHEHSHGGVTHSHAPAPATATATATASTISWRGLFALGLAGGLIPSTSALIILLGSIASGRPTFGFVLVVIFGLGMAVVLGGVGLALVLARERLDRLPGGSGLGRFAQHASLIAAVVVLAFGLYLTAQAVVGPPVF